jgi:hypothetical protein
MNLRLRWKLLLGLTLPLVALGIWRHSVHKARAAERDLFFAYVDGPLNDYAFAVTRGLLVVLKSDTAELAEARHAAKQSADALQALLQSSQDGWVKTRLAYVLPLHLEMASMLEALPLPKSRQAAWLEEEKALREKLIYMLEDVRYENFSKWKMTQSRFLELNALIYSLKEAQTAAAQ